MLLIAEAPRTVDGLGKVRYVATAPDPDLLAKDPKSARPASADGTLGNDTAFLSAPVLDRRLLDHEHSLGQLDLKGGVARSRTGRRCKRAVSALRRRGR